MENDFEKQHKALE